MLKRMILFICIIFCVISTKALTLDESKSIASFAKNFINDGMSGEHLDANGMPVLAYMQGEKRITGYNGKMSKLNNDYNKTFKVNSKKWCFDCSSFISYVYKVTLNMELLDSNYLGGNPYMVKNFLNDGIFTKVYKNLNKDKLLSVKNDLLPGDLIVIGTGHITMYVGNDEIAEASSKLIKKYNSNLGLKYNLGTGVSSFSDFLSRWSSGKFTVLRLNYILASGKKINTTITWPDTNKTVDLLVRDDLKITKTSDNYVKVAKIILQMKDNHKIYKYAIGNNNSYQYQNGNNQNSMEIPISQNGRYYISVIDEWGNLNYQTIEITNIDIIPPIIKECYYDKEYIYVDATDELSGIDQEGYSFDGGVTWTSDNKYQITDNGTYNIIVRDKLYNTVETKLEVSVIEEVKEEPQEEDPKEEIEEEPKKDNNIDNKTNNNVSNDNSIDIYQIIKIVLIVLTIIVGIYLIYKYIKEKRTNK